MRFAIIGDYGDVGLPEWGVSDLVHAFGPDLILTVGDNNYPVGSAATIDVNIGFFYQDFIYPYTGGFGPGATENRFFPALGNHDWLTPSLQPYLDYFSLPGNERYYDVRRGDVHFFILDSDSKEPDGIDQGSIQAAWLQGALAASSAAYKLVLLHHAPYSSALHGPHPRLQWPYKAWGADAVFAGHDHVYERLELDGLTYAVNGLGGRPFIYNFRTRTAGSTQDYNNDYGAILAEVHANRIRFQFVTQTGVVFDDFSLFRGDATPAPEVLVAKDATWRFHDLGSAPVGAWMSVGFDDSSWGSGPTELGYGDGDEATVVSFGPDPANKHIATYLRHGFNLTDVASVDRLHVHLQTDDGGVLYLNGSEVYRQNMPSGVVDGSTLASYEVTAAPERSFFGVELDPSLLSSGTNLLALSLHQASASSDDLSFGLQLTVVRDIELLLPRGSAWRYLDTGVAPAGDWTEPGFDDAGWSLGNAQLGYGDGDEDTLVSFGPDPMDKHITTYFRTEFQVPDASAFGRYELSLLRDDGVIVYLNGREVYRNNLSRGALGSEERAAETIGPADESFILRTHLDPGLVQSGTNTFAVELHQVSPSSSDLSFDLELHAH